jgi:hypothetical protein
MMRPWARALSILAVCLTLLAPAAGRATTPPGDLTLETAVGAARALATSRDLENARALIRAAGAYAAGRAARPLPAAQAPAFEALLALSRSTVADWLIVDDAMRQRIRGGRILLGALVDDRRAPDRATLRSALTAGTCPVLLDAAILRPAETRRLLLVLVDGSGDLDAEQRRCAARAIAFDAEFGPGDLPRPGELLVEGDDDTIAWLAQFVAAQGRFAEAMALAGEAADPALRARLQAAVIAMRQITGLGLNETDFLKALWAQTRQRTGAERFLFGALLATRATPEFWLAEVTTLAAFVEAGKDDPATGFVAGLAGRRLAQSAGLAEAAKVWAKAPSLRPPPGFLMLLAGLTDVGAAGAARPPAGLEPALQRAMRVARDPGAAFGAALGGFPGSGASALDVATLLLAAGGGR